LEILLDFKRGGGLILAGWSEVLGLQYGFYAVVAKYLNG
jgi:hypothetical protein